MASILPPSLVRNQLAFLLAKAACEVFPDAQVVNAASTDTLFFADLHFSQSFDAAFLPLIEERLRLLLKKEPQLHYREMVGASAKGLLESAKQPLQTRKLPLNGRILVDIWTLDGFALLAPECNAEELEENPIVEPRFWELIQAFEAGDVDGAVVVRILGFATEELGVFKATRKTWAKSPYIPPDIRVEQKKLLTPYNDSWIWLPEGERLRQQLYKLWHELAAGKGYALVSTGGGIPLEEGVEEIFQRSYQLEKGPQILRLAEASYGELEPNNFLHEGILTPLRGWSDRLVAICPKEQVQKECISSLQFILQIPRMLSFEAQIVLCSSPSGEVKELRTALKAASIEFYCESRERKNSSIEVRLRDRLGRWWPGPSLWIGEKWARGGLKSKQHPAVRALYLSCFGTWERLVGLLAERDGDIPLLQNLQREQEVRFEN